MTTVNIYFLLLCIYFDLRWGPVLFHFCAPIFCSLFCSILGDIHILGDIQRDSENTLRGHLFLPQLHCNVCSAILTKTNSIDKHTGQEKGLQQKRWIAVLFTSLNIAGSKKLFKNCIIIIEQRSHGNVLNSSLWWKCLKINLILDRKKTSLGFWPLIKVLQACVLLVPENFCL